MDTFLIAALGVELVVDYLGKYSSAELYSKCYLALYVVGDADFFLFHFEIVFCCTVHSGLELMIFLHQPPRIADMRQSYSYTYFLYFNILLNLILYIYIFAYSIFMSIVIN